MQQGMMARVCNPCTREAEEEDQEFMPNLNCNSNFQATRDA